jgi:hypothetical protein
MTKDEALKLCDYLECNDASMEAQFKAASFIREVLAQPEQWTPENAAVRAAHTALAEFNPEQEPVTDDKQRSWILSDKYGNPLQEPTFKVTVVDDQHPNGIPLEQWGKTHES